jgi:predicted amidohydrolase
VVAGSFSPADDGRVHNTVLVRGPGGSPTLDYRKIHLFDAFDADESATVAPGQELITFDLEGTRFGIATCYDMRFPEQFTALARRGAQAIVLPTAWAAGPGKREQLQLLLRARALDSTSVILAADQSPPAGYTGKRPARHRPLRRRRPAGPHPSGARPRAGAADGRSRPRRDRGRTRRPAGAAPRRAAAGGMRA